MLLLLPLIPIVLSNRTYPTFAEHILVPQNYDRLVSPYEKFREPMIIHVSIPICILAEVDESRQMVSYIAAANVTWYDARLKFDPEEMGYDSVIIPSMQVWLPSVDVFNTVDMMIPDREVPSNDVFIDHTGFVFMFLKAKFDTICSFDLEGFPFDTQFCNIGFELSLYPDTLAIMRAGAPSELIIGLPEWNIDHPIINITKYYSNAKNTSYSMALVSFKLVRNPQFYVYMLILPTMIITTTTMGAVLAPLGINHGERINIGIAGLLGLTFMLSVIVVQVPRSTKLPLIGKFVDYLLQAFPGKWMLIEMFLCIAAIVWESPLSCLKLKLLLRYGDRSKKWKEWIPLALSLASLFLFLTTNIVMTIVLFNTPPQPNHIGDRTWYDPRLRFDPEQMGYNWTLVPSILLWIPPIEPFNTIELKFLDRETPSNQVTIHHSGMASLTMRGKYDTSCACDVEAFPYDTQYCSMNFVGLYSDEQAILNTSTETQLLLGLPEWKMFASTETLAYDTLDRKTFSMARLIFRLERNPQFYIYFLIIPTVIVTFTCLSALLLPLGIEEGEKANIGLSGLLGLTFMLSIVVLQVPRSPKLPLLGKWLIIQMGYCVGALIWEMPFSYLKNWLGRRYNKTKKGREILISSLSVASALLFIGSDLIATGIMFSTAESPAPGPEKII